MNQSLLILIFNFLTDLTDLPILNHNFPFFVPVTSWHTTWSWNPLLRQH